MADTIAGAAIVGDDVHTVDVCSSEDVFAALVPEGTWQWMKGDRAYHGSTYLC